jgi:hypothetical protein
MSFAALLALNLDAGSDLSWWLVFLPVFGASACVVWCALRNFASVQSEAARRDPAMFGPDPAETSSPYAKMNEEKKGEDGGPPSPLTDEERDELKSRVAQSAYRAAGTCLSQCFVVVMACVLIGKIEGAGYSLLIVISPFLAAGGVVLCCLACTIFCISEVDENAGMAEFDTAVGRAAAGVTSGYGGAAAKGYDPPKAQRRGDSPDDTAATEHHSGALAGASTTTTTTSSCGISKPPPSSIWDPELGEIWQNVSVEEDEEKGTKEEEEEGSDAKRKETKKSTDVPDADCRTIEANQSMSSSQCDLD